MNSDPLEKKSTLAQNVIMRQIQRHISRSITNINMRVSDILVDIVIIKLLRKEVGRIILGLCMKRLSIPALYPSYNLDSLLAKKTILFGS